MGMVPGQFLQPILMEMKILMLSHSVKTIIPLNGMKIREKKNLFPIKYPPMQRAPGQFMQLMLKMTGTWIFCRSIIMKTPPTTLDNVSCAANAKAKPAIPSPASIALTSTPSVPDTVIRSSIHIVTFATFWINISTVLSKSTRSKKREI